ncbi:MAG: hypothetical protein N2A97_05965 [Thermodesulfobacteriales bacterium]
MKKRKIIGLLTILAGLPGLGGFWLIGQLDTFPLLATVIVFNAIFFRGICGTVGGILIWRGSKWGYYLTLITWLYLIVVSVLTLSQLYNNGIVLSYGFLEENYSSFGRPFLLSSLKILFGIPIVHVVLNILLKSHKSNHSV